MYRERVKKATYEELEEELLNPKLIVLNRPIKIPRFNMIENVNDVDFNDFDLDNHNIKTMLNKSTQKDYELQNHDLFPEMYEEIDATGSVMGKNDAVPEPRKLREMRTQTKRPTLLPKVLISIIVSAQCIEVVSLALHHHPITYHDLLHQKSSRTRNRKEKGIWVFQFKGVGYV